jgi:hypothetical protein
MNMAVRDLSAHARSIRRFVERVGEHYAVRSVLEGPVSGGGPTMLGGHASLLAARGVSVTAAVRRVEDEAGVRSAYAAQSLVVPEIRVVSDPFAPAALPEADLVVSYDAAPQIADWERYLEALARAARKALLVIVPNPDHALDHERHPGRETDRLGRVLWGVGRVREHAFLAVPAWMPMLRAIHGSQVVDGTVQAPAGRWVRLSAPLHAFVVDTAPRTPQARRRLAVAAP